MNPTIAIKKGQSPLNSSAIPSYSNPCIQQLLKFRLFAKALVVYRSFGLLPKPWYLPVNANFYRFSLSQSFSQIVVPKHCPNHASVDHCSVGLSIASNGVLLQPGAKGQWELYHQKDTSSYRRGALVEVLFHFFIRRHSSLFVILLKKQTGH